MSTPSERDTSRLRTLEPPAVITGDRELDQALIELGLIVRQITERHRDERRDDA